jgi:hypothetical protein
MTASTTFRPEFIAGLKLLAEAFGEVVVAGYSRPILVGGAAVEFFTGGSVTSGDFDVVSPAAQDVLEQALLRRGFERPAGIGVLLRGLHHPKLLIGVEVVSGDLFDGAADIQKVVLVQVEGEKTIALPSVEDMIADRVGQFSCTNKDLEMLGQAVILYKIARDNLETAIDEGYLDARIRTETGDSYNLSFLVEQSR